MASDEVIQTRRLIDGLRRDRRTDWRHGRREYSQRLRAVIARCEALLSREPDAVPALTRRSVELVTSALASSLDDPSGVIGDDLDDLMRLHARACTAAAPRPERLAAWLAGLVFDGPGWPEVRLREFAGALGEPGRLELERIVEERARTVDPSAGLGEFAVRYLREQLVEISGDVDRFIATLLENPRDPERYVRIVDALRGAGRMDEAERWARDGLDATSHPTYLDRLRDRYVELLLARGADTDATDFRADVLRVEPTADHYAELRDTAIRTGAWDAVRGPARQRMYTEIDRLPGVVPELIRVLIDFPDEPADHDAVWRLAVDNPDQVPETLWRELLDLRIATHPADVIEPYQWLIEQRLNNAKDQYRYNRAVTMLRQLRVAYQADGDLAGYATYMSDLRDRHKRKTAFLAKLESSRL